LFGATALAFAGQITAVLCAMPQRESAGLDGIRMRSPKRYRHGDRSSNYPGLLNSRSLRVVVHGSRLTASSTPIRDVVARKIICWKEELKVLKSIKCVRVVL
jgi:hypothetical protein